MNRRNIGLDTGTGGRKSAEQSETADDHDSNDRKVHNGDERVFGRVSELLDDVTVADAKARPKFEEVQRRVILPPIASQEVDGDLKGKPQTTGQVENVSVPQAPLPTDKEPDADDAGVDVKEINIKGRGDGVSIEVGEGDWRLIMIQLTARLNHAAGFFSGGQVALDVGARVLTEDALNEAQTVFKEHDMTLGMVRSNSPETFQAALNLGLAASLDTPNEHHRIDAKLAPTNFESQFHFVYQGNLRSGQILRRKESILIIGDVNPGGQVISDGDILIWGRLRGVAFAGAAGDANAIVGAMVLEPIQLRIADVVGVMPLSRVESSGGWFRRREVIKTAEVAHTVGETIAVIPWHEMKPRGMTTLRN